MNQANPNFGDPLSRVYANSFHETLEALTRSMVESEQPNDQSPQIEGALREWQQVIAAQEPEQWIRRLSWDGLDARVARIAVSDELHLSDQPPPWKATLDGMREALRTPPESAQQSAPSVTQCDRTTVAFQDIWLPVSVWAVTQLKSSLALHAVQGIAPDAWDSMRRTLLRRLSRVSESVLISVFNRERDVDAMLRAYRSVGEDPSGSLPTAIYDSFVKRTLESSLQDVLKEFPVLGRHLATTIELWLAAMAEFLNRLSKDREIIARTFGINESVSVTNLEFGLSDPHRGGRVVVVIHFAGDAMDATGSKVVYKPKDMRLDYAYQRAVRVWPVAPGYTPLRTLKVVPCQGYGYMEFVEHHAAKDEAELERFYNNAGRLTAVLYILGCTDCHYENLIADGDQLLLIDTETLLEGKLRCLINDAATQPQSRSEIQVRLSSAVTRSGLLPSWEVMGEARTAIDISALGAESPLEAVRMTGGWLGINTDGMMAGMIEEPSEVPPSLPYAIGQHNRFNEFLEPFCTGFRADLLQFLRHRAEWIAPDGILGSFRGVSRRFVARPTRTYFQLMMHLTEPDALRSTSAQGFVLERLALAFLAAPNKPENWSIFKAELRDMEMLDIPAFEHLVDSTNILLPHDLGKVEGLIEVSGLESCRARIESLSHDDIDLQVRLIRGVTSARWIQLDESRCTHAQGGTGNARHTRRSISAKNRTDNLSEDERLQEAVRIGSNLQRDAVSTEVGRIDWLGLSLGDDGARMSYGLLDRTMYCGTPGIAIFFAALGADYLPLARACVSETIELAHKGHPGLLWRWWRDQSLGINGCGGTLLALQILSELDNTQSEQYDVAIDRLISALHADRIADDAEFDIMAGCSGLIGALLRRGTAQSINLARQAGDHILVRQNERGGWTLTNKRWYVGFAHGSAGICAALSALYSVTREIRFVQKISHALALEESCFQREFNNWLRYTEDNSPPKNTWCHGAPGIALSRLCLLRNNVTAAEIGSQAYSQVQRDLELALNTTANFRSAASLDHLCCGTFGRSGILRLAGRVAEAAQIESIAHAAAAQQGGLYGFGNAARVDAPSLFRGSAGIGLSLLQSPYVATVLSAGLLG